MALITCKNCGAEISDQALNCPKCGVMIRKKIALPNVSKKILIVLGCIIGVLMAGFIGMRTIRARNEAKLDSTEEYVLRCVQTLMREEGNISLENDILYSAKDNGRTFVLVEFRSGSGRDMAYFENQEYIGTGTDYALIDNYDSDDVDAGRITKSEYQEILEKRASFAAADVEVAGWNLMAGMGVAGSENMRLVSAEKIGKKLGISYPKR